MKTREKKEWTIDAVLVADINPLRHMKERIQLEYCPNPRNMRVSRTSNTHWSQLKVIIIIFFYSMTHIFIMNENNLWFTLNSKGDNLNDNEIG